MTTLGDRIKAARKDAGLTLRDVVKAGGFSLGNLSDIENAKITDPGFATVAKLADTLGTTVAELNGEPAGELFEVPWRMLIGPRRNPRGDVDPGQLDGLANSIDAKGIEVPLLGRRAPAGFVEIVAGERRWQAFARLVGAGRRQDTDTLPVRIRDYSDTAALEAGLVENLERQDMAPLAEARAYKMLRDDDGLSTADQAKRFGKSKRHIQSRIQLVERLQQRTQDGLNAGKITLAQAEALAQAPQDIQEPLYHRARRGELRTEDQIRAAIEEVAEAEAQEPMFSDNEGQPAPSISADGAPDDRGQPEPSGPDTDAAPDAPPADRERSVQHDDTPPAASSPSDLDDRPATQPIGNTRPPSLPAGQAATVADPTDPDAEERRRLCDIPPELRRAADPDAPRFTVTIEHTYAAGIVQQPGTDLAAFDLAAFIAGTSRDPNVIRRIVIEREEGEDTP